MGLMDYKARFYSPLLRRFVQPDTIVPDLNNPQDWNRYAYTRNNPVKYTDSTGHFIDPVSLAIGGAAIGFLGSIAFQMGASLISGESSNISQAFEAVDWKTAITYGVAGAVAGATYGAINPAATVAGVALASGTAGLVSGQAAALFDAGWDSTDKIIDGQKPETSYGMDFLQDAHEAGFMDWKQMAFDFGTGAVLGGAVQGVNRFLTLPLGGTYVTAASRAENSLAGQYGSLIIGTSIWAEEQTQQFFDKKYERLEQRLNSLEDR
jgi:hypothetical protein